MGSYRTLFTVSVGHTYFADGRWSGLEFIPAGETPKLIKGAGILLRCTGNGVAAFYDEQKWDALRLYAEGVPETLRFAFKVYAKDRTFENFTALSVRRETSVLRFQNAGGDGSGKATMTAEDFVTATDFADVDALIADGMLDAADKRFLPDFVVNALVVPGKGPEVAAQELCMTFAARKAFWKYHFLWNAGKSDIFIVDLDNQVEFEPRGEIVLPGNRPARVFMSNQRIPVQEKSNVRFQLRERGQGGGKVLVKRLPVASESRLGRDIINGESEIVLESYVNL